MDDEDLCTSLNDGFFDTDAGKANGAKETTGIHTHTYKYTLVYNIFTHIYTSKFAYTTI